ncbi:MAG: hypothetical protein JW763_04185 [candidate division Zixibacteria bacterium]|nr:hypothetical protein [candidate division Zixibacteria bacterium]
MPLRYQVSTDGFYVRATCYGILTSEDVIAYIQKLMEDDRVKPGFRQLFDVSGVEDAMIAPDQYKSVTDVVLGNPKKGKNNMLAIVAGTGKVYLKARQYEVATSPHIENAIVFNSIRTAEIWLGVTDLELSPLSEPIAG